MCNTELKVIRAAIRSTRDLIHTLNDGRKMPKLLDKIYFELNDDAIILSGMIEEDVKEVEDWPVAQPRKFWTQEDNHD